MRMFPLLLALAAPAAVLPAHAQDGITYDKAAVQTCLDAADGDMARQSCIGTASDACMAAPGGASTAGMNQCLTAEKDDWDRLLNENYNTLVAAAKTRDAAIGDAATAKSLPLLQKMQRDWIAYRDSSCIYAASGFQGGTAAGPVAGICILQLTAEQALRLGAMSSGTQ